MQRLEQLLHDAERRQAARELLIETIAGVGALCLLYLLYWVFI